MSENPWEQMKTLQYADAGTITVTLKQNAKHDAAWIVIKAPSAEAAKRMLCESFGHDPESASVAPFTLAELTATFADSFQGVAAVQDILGGRIVDPSTGTPAALGSSQADTVNTSPGKESVWDGKPDNVLAIYAMILASPDSKHLSGAVWSQYHTTISGDGDLMALFKETMKSLTEAEKAAASTPVQATLV